MVEEDTKRRNNTGKDTREKKDKEECMSKGRRLSKEIRGKTEVDEQGEGSC